MKSILARRSVITLMLFAVALFAVQFALVAVAHAQGAPAPAATPEVSGVVSTLVLGSAAAMPTGYIVGFFKHAYPEATGRSLIVVAVIAGLLSSVLMTMLAGGIQTTQVGIASMVIQGIAAGALSAGIGATNSTGDAKRTEAQGGTSSSGGKGGF